MNKRMTFLVAIISPLLGLVSGRAIAQGTAKKQSADEFKLRFEEHQRSVERRVEITPKQDGGINSGLIVVFGHAINPPYKIQFDDNRLLVNGIVVRPSPIQQREHARIYRSSATDEVAQAKKVNLLMNTAQDMYRAKIETLSQTEIEKQILSYVKKQEIVVDAKWTSLATMDVTVKNADKTSFRLVIQFTKTTPVKRSANDIKANAAKNQEHHQQALEAQLRRDECIFFSTDGGESDCSSFSKDDFEKKINRIMADTKLTDEDRLAQVRSVVGGNLVPALDIIANYHAAEWEPSSH